MLGPPVAQQKEVQHIFQKGDDMKILCPIQGNPAPLIEWEKGGEKIDYSWIRLRVVKRWLKVKGALVGDTGQYTCKGVNGFGTTQVKVKIIVLGEINCQKHLYLHTSQARSPRSLFNYKSFWLEAPTIPEKVT